MKESQFESFYGHLNFHYSDLNSKRGNSNSLGIAQFMRERLQLEIPFPITEKGETRGGLLEFECHLDIQAGSSNNVCSKWRMKIKTEKKTNHIGKI